MATDLFDRLNSLNKSFEKKGLLGPRKPLTESRGAAPEQVRTILEDLRSILKESEVTPTAEAEQVLERISEIASALISREGVRNSVKEACGDIDDAAAVLHRRIARGGLDEASMESDIESLAGKLLEALEDAVPSLSAGKTESDDDDADDDDGPDEEQAARLAKKLRAGASVESND